MQLRFGWTWRDGTGGPSCSVPGGDPGYNALTSLLTDDGGRGWRSLRGWPAEGARRAAEVAPGRLAEADWVSDSWVAYVRPDGVKVASLLDEDFAVRLSLADFTRVLLAWDRFLAGEPDAAASELLEVTELATGADDSRL